MLPSFNIYTVSTISCPRKSPPEIFSVENSSRCLASDSLLDHPGRRSGQIDRHPYLESATRDVPVLARRRSAGQKRAPRSNRSGLLPQARLTPSINSPGPPPGTSDALTRGGEAGWDSSTARRALRSTFLMTLYEQARREAPWLSRSSSPSTISGRDVANPPRGYIGSIRCKSLDQLLIANCSYKSPELRPRDDRRKGVNREFTDRTDASFWLGLTR